MRRFGLRTLLVLIAVFACVLGLGVYVVRSIDSSVRNMYAVWWVGDMIVMHLEKNEDRWPESWDDLRDDYDACVEEAGQPWTFQELRNRVEIDWNADPEALRALPPDENGDAPFRVVRLRDGSEAYYVGREPNRMIHRYLQKLPPDP